MSSITYKLTIFENPMKLVTLFEMPINVHFQPLTWGPLLQQRPPPQLACYRNLLNRLQPWAAPTIRKHHQGQDHQTDWRWWFKVRNYSKPNFIEKDTYDKLKKISSSLSQSLTMSPLESSLLNFQRGDLASA